MKLILSSCAIAGLLSAVFFSGSDGHGGFQGSSSPRRWSFSHRWSSRFDPDSMGPGQAPTMPSVFPGLSRMSPDQDGLSPTRSFEIKRFFVDQDGQNPRSSFVVHRWFRNHGDVFPTTSSVDTTWYPDQEPYPQPPPEPTRDSMSQTPKSGDSTGSTAFSADDIKYIVDYHNRLRSKVAPSAANMLEVTWDDRLAARAQKYADQCNYEHSPKWYRKNQDGFKNIGENIYISTADDYRRGLKYWGDEDEFYDFGNNYCRPGEQCGHYTQMAWHWSNKVGCGHAFCRRVKNWGRNNAYFTVCMYGPQGNWNGDRPYSPGPSCSKCPQGTKCRDNLCC